MNEKLVLYKADWFKTASKEEIKIASEQHFLELIENGDMDLPKLVSITEKVSLYFDTLKSVLKKNPSVLSEVQKLNKDESVSGVSLAVGEAGVKYDYVTTNDPVWAKINADLEAIEEKRKDREKFLKTIKGHMTIVDEDTGEVVTIYPPAKTSTTTIKATIK